MKKFNKGISFSVLAGMVIGSATFALSAAVENGLIDQFDEKEQAYVADILTEEEMANNIRFKPLYTPTDANYSTQKSRSMNNVGNIESVWDNYKGDGVTIAVIDTGIDYMHPDFYTNPSDYTTCKISKDSRYYYNSGSRLLYKTVGVERNTLGQQTEYDCLLHDWDDEYDEWDAHGSNVAGSAAASANGVGTVGIAPNANILVLKTDFYFNSINAAINYAVSLGYVDVINMSLGAYAETFNDGYGDLQEGSSSTASAMTSAINNAYNAGIIVIAAAGNEKTDHYSYPACNNHVIGVGALNKNSNTTAAGFSNFNKTTDTATGNHNVDVMAPGYVYAPNEGGTQSSPNHSAYCDTQGTSFASPIVAGAAALYKQKNPTATPDEFEADLYQSCVDIGSTGWDYKFGYGRLDVYNLMSVSKAASGVSIDQSSATIYSGTTLNRFKQVQLNAEVTPATATNKNVTWTSSKSTVATVSSTGLVTAVAPGTTTITARSQDGGFTATCSITVNPWVSVTGISISDSEGHTSGTLLRRKTAQLNIEVSPANATLQDYVCISSDESVATVTDTGLVTAKSAGTTEITVLTDDGEFEATYNLEVTAPAGGTGYVVVDFYNGSSFSATDGTGLSLTYLNSHTTIEGTQTNAFTAYKTDSGSVRCDMNGGLTFGAGKSNGKGTFTLASDYAAESITIYGAVYDSGSTITLNSTTGTGSLSAKGTTMADASYLTFEDLGGITSFSLASSAKRATVYKMEIEYTAPGPAPVVDVTGVSINDHEGVNISDTSGSIVLETGATEQLAAVITPNDATNKNVTWNTNNSAVATVSESGLVTATGVGDAVITVTTEDGGFTASANITVEAPRIVDYVRINPTAKVAIGGSVDITAEASGTVSWSKTDGTGSISLSNQSNTGVTINGLTAGSATVTAQCGDEVAVCNVSVTDPSASDDWTRVDDAATLVAGDVIALGSADNNAAAGLLGVGKYLPSLAATFTDDIMECDDAAMFELGGTVGAWTLTSEEGTLGATAAKAMANDTGTTTWTITINANGDAAIKSTNTSFGTIGYNVGSPRFLNYTSDQGAIQIYRKGGAVLPDVPKTIESVTVAPTSLGLDVNGNGNSSTGQLEATVKVAGKTGEIDETVTWTTGNANVATVNPDTGLVTAVGAGSTTITATSNADSTKFGSASVTVTANTRELTGITVTTNPTKTKYNVGETFDPTGAVVTATYNYAPTSEVVTDRVTWTPTAPLTTSDTKAFVSFTDGGITKSTSVTIKVTEAGSVTAGFVKVTTMDEIETGDYVITGYYGGAYNAFVNTFANSSNNAEVTVTDDTIATADAENYKITITQVNGGYTLSNASGKYLSPSSSTSFATTTNATNAAVFTITCNNGLFQIFNGSRGVMYRDGYGFKNYGTGNYTNTGYTQLTLFKDNGGSVVPPTPIPLTGITLNKTSLTLNVNAFETLVASFQPENADDKSVTWFTMADSIATVDQTGKVTGVSEGTTTIYVMSNADSTIFAECEVTINAVVVPPSTENRTGVQDIFSELTGFVNGDTNISYAAEKGSAANDPVINSSQIRIYQNGGILRLTANNGTKINSIIIGSDMNTTITTSEDGGTASSNVAISKGETVTLEGFSADEVVIRCTGTDKTSRLYLNYLEVVYSAPSAGNDLADAVAWAQNFLAAVTCDNGVNAPSTTVWSAQSTAYAALSEGAKTYIVSATYTKSGHGTTTVVTAGDSTDQDIAEAIARYDYIVMKYGASTYANFIGRTISSSNNLTTIYKDTASAALASAVISVLSLTAIAVLVANRKKVFGK